MGTRVSLFLARARVSTIVPRALHVAVKSQTQHEQQEQPQRGQRRACPKRVDSSACRLLLLARANARSEGKSEGSGGGSSSTGVGTLGNGLELFRSDRDGVAGEGDAQIADHAGGLAVGLVLGVGLLLKRTRLESTNWSITSALPHQHAGLVRVLVVVTVLLGGSPFGRKHLAVVLERTT